MDSYPATPQPNSEFCWFVFQRSLLVYRLSGRFCRYKLEQFGAKSVLEIFGVEEAVCSFRQFVFIHGSPEKRGFRNTAFCTFAATDLTVCSARSGNRVPVTFPSVSGSDTVLLLLLLSAAAAEGCKGKGKGKSKGNGKGESKAHPKTDLEDSEG
jgi:hypothetical protein